MVRKAQDTTHNATDDAANARPMFDRAALIAVATQHGFSDLGITRTADFGPIHGKRLGAFLDDGRHGTMDWMASTADRRRHPNAMWPQAKSLVALAFNYGPETDPLDAVAITDHAAISVYAKGKDYHVVIKKALKHVAGWLAEATGAEVKVFVDTAPLMEKPLAQLAGLGWQGKHTNLVSRTVGSWFFIGTILTTAELPPDAPERDHCGTCRACLDICPTDAFPAPYQLDPRRCISYLTIEHEGDIPDALKPLMGNRIFGCDDCLAVCPWNKFASRAADIRLKARVDVDNPPLAELAKLSPDEWANRFAGTPVKRTGYARFMRNVGIAIENAARIADRTK